MASLSTNSLLQSTPPLLARLRRLWSRVVVRRRQRGLRVYETVSLGDKRFVAVLEFEQQRFLIGVTSQSVSLLQALGLSTPPVTAPTAHVDRDGKRDDKRDAHRGDALGEQS